MSGRAGRRGMDERGIVIMIVDEKLSPSVGKALVKVRWKQFVETEERHLLINSILAPASNIMYLTLYFLLT